LKNRISPVFLYFFRVLRGCGRPVLRGRFGGGLR